MKTELRQRVTCTHWEVRLRLRHQQMFVQTIPKRTMALDDNRTDVCIERYRIEQSMHSKTCRTSGNLSSQ
jgi:hypothetical protein